jgi:hypothetical protein
MRYAEVPHLKALIHYGIVGNDHELFRDELLAIIDVMCGRLNTKSLRSHTIAPVSFVIETLEETWSSDVLSW